MTPPKTFKANRFILDFAGIAKQFTDFYYNQFDADRSQLAPLYRDNSMLTFESAAVAGAGPIVEKLSSLPFAKVKHQVSTLDAQPVEGGGIIILVTGALLVDEEQRPMNYSQCFQLLPDGAGSYFIFNDIFKLVFE
ncbi:Nuclear transport factor 2 [Pseudogymnoascus australis]